MEILMPLLLSNIHSFIRVALHVNTQQAQVDGQVRGASLGQALPRRAPQQEERQARCVLCCYFFCCYSIIHNSSIPTHNILPEGTWKYCCLLLMMKNGPFFILFIQYFLKIGT